MTGSDEQSAPLPVFADVDTGVDDAMALAYLLASTEAELVGIASTSGNVAAQQVCINNLGLLELCGAGAIPVSKGADEPLSTPLRTAEDTHGPQGLGYAELPPSNRSVTPYSATEAWVRAAHAYPGQLTGLVTGPMTNLALALRVEPALPKLLRQLVIMGGSFEYRGNTDVVAEWNISVDPEAASEVFAAWSGHDALPIVLGLNLTENIVMTPAIFARLAETAGSSAVAPNPLIRVLEDALRFYFEFHEAQGEGYLAHLHDPLAAAVALDPSLVQTRTATVDVELAGTLTRGMTIADWSGRWGRPPNAEVGVAVDPALFFEHFIERVGAFAQQLPYS